MPNPSVVMHAHVCIACGMRMMISHAHVNMHVTACSVHLQGTCMPAGEECTDKHTEATSMQVRGRADSKRVPAACGAPRRCGDEVQHVDHCWSVRHVMLGSRACAPPAISEYLHLFADSKLSIPPIRCLLATRTCIPTGPSPVPALWSFPVCWASLRRLATHCRH